MLSSYDTLYTTAYTLSHSFDLYSNFNSLVTLQFKTNFLLEDVSTLFNYTWVVFAFLPLFIIFWGFSKLAVSLNMWVEEEINALDDLIFFVGFLATIFLLFSYNFFAGQTWYTPYLGVLSLLFFVFFILSIIFGFLLFFGYYIPIFINGAAKTNSYMWNLIIDCLSIFSFITRFVVQLVRILILGATYYFSSLLFHEIGYFNVSTTLTSSYLQSFLVTGIRLLFEIAHLLVIFGMQTIAFCFITLWLVQFLYTCFFTISSELTFYKK